ncbi:hypothetical protein C7974DRAFT_423532 [Boeremia exigua]|uniref:uncharacterized protein n=1 Tax=Boeremia exigua TaxID=749465 RepID=UPI001E8D4249|nr:uncharacterized protein C7974DRAFT_423532 [Boeremia exigua]KAH6633125.1 hypothetical protein C7974DRAFT_423532 [Boeremia exigua]
MSHDPERRLSTGGVPPIQTRDQYLVEEVSSHDGTSCYTVWVREEIVKVPQGWSASDFTIADKRPHSSLQIYDTTPNAADPDHLKNLAEKLHKETREKRGVNTRDQPDRIDVWGIPFTADASEEERIAKCKAQISAEIAAREASGDDNFHIPELRSHYQWNRAIIIIDQPEDCWNEGEGGFLAVYWDVHPSYLEMLAQAYGEDYQQPDMSAVRCTRDELGELLGRLSGFF